jgi:hypothetical protein
MHPSSVTIFLSLFSLPVLRRMHTILTTTWTLIRRDPRTSVAVLDSRPTRVMPSSSSLGSDTSTQGSHVTLVARDTSLSLAALSSSSLCLSPGASSAATPRRPPQRQARSAVTIWCESLVAQNLDRIPQIYIPLPLLSASFPTVESQV